MACESAYLRVTDIEKDRRNAANLLVYLMKQLKLKIPEEIIKSSEDYYGQGGEKAIPLLCELLTDMPRKKREKIIYNAHDPMARKLADWYEKHRIADKKRQAEKSKEYWKIYETSQD